MHDGTCGSDRYRNFKHVRVYISRGEKRISVSWMYPLYPRCIPDTRILGSVFLSLIKDDSIGHAKENEWQFILLILYYFTGAAVMTISSEHSTQIRNIHFIIHSFCSEFKTITPHRTTYAISKYMTKQISNSLQSIILIY